MALAVRVAKPALSLRGPGVSRRAAAPRVLCSAKKADGQQAEAPRVALPVAALVGAALLTSALVPEEALAAKSSGRVGGSGFSSRRAAAPSAASSSTTYNTVVAPPVVVAPPMIGGYGFGGFGFGFAPTFFMPIGFGFGGIIQFFLIMAVFSAVAGFIRGAMAARNNGSSVDSKDDWGQL